MEDQRKATRDIIREMLRVTGWTPTELARKAKVSPSTVTRFYNQPVKYNLSTTTLGKLAGASGVAVPGVVSVPPESDDAESGALPPTNIRPALGARPLPARMSMDRNVPIYGTGQGGEEGVFHLNREDGPIDWARRPSSLVGVDQAFAIYLEGDSMKPWRKPGALIYAHESRTANIGDYVIVVMRSAKRGDEPRAWVKELVRRTATRIILRQHNPPKEISLDIKQVAKIYRVYDLDELLTA